MTREEAINKWIVPAIKNTWNEKKCNEILKALEQEPCEDCISRAEAINAIEEYGSVWMEYTEEMSIHQIAERALKASK